MRQERRDEQPSKRTALLPIPRGTKKPVFEAWQKTDYEDTQAKEYYDDLEDALARGGNIGVLLGAASGNLVARGVFSSRYRYGGE